MNAAARLARLALALLPVWAAAAEQRPGLQPCRLQGVEHEAWCGSVRRPLNPQQPAGVQIDVHFAVLPALARNRLPDPVLFFAGGPGQSAIALAGSAGRLLARLSNRRDIVLVDLRGTGRSAPLACDLAAPATAPLAGQMDPQHALARLSDCRQRLQRLPHGDLRHYGTALAVQDVDAVRRALGASQLNLVGGSYGTRAALEYMRQFPQAVRRAVLDGVAPPDMGLPAAQSADAQAALDAVFAACEADAGCSARQPGLRAAWRQLLTSLPRKVTVAHAFTGVPEQLVLTRDAVLGLVRQPLYLPALAAALPAALDQAGRGRFEPLFALALAAAPQRPGQMAEGLHFSVVCGEDLRPPAGLAEPAAPGGDFGDSFARHYRQVCADWPAGTPPAGFYQLPPAPAATLLLSGGADPVTPPRHGARVAQALGPRARHAVVVQAGHGLMGLPCVRDVVYRFIAAADDAAALAVDADCARDLPRPGAFVPLGAGAAP